MADKMLRVAGRGEDGKAKPFKTTNDGTQLMQLSGSNLDKRDLAANKPAANTVPVGTTFWSVDTNPKGDAVEVSNGTAWVVL